MSHTEAGDFEDDDNALMDQLNDLAGEGDNDEYEEVYVTDEDIPDPAVRSKQLDDLVKEETRKAISFKKAGDTKTAMEHLKKKKAYAA